MTFKSKHSTHNNTKTSSYTHKQTKCTCDAFSDDGIVLRRSHRKCGCTIYRHFMPFFRLKRKIQISETLKRLTIYLDKKSCQNLNIFFEHLNNKTNKKCFLYIKMQLLFEIVNLGIKKWRFLLS